MNLGMYETVIVEATSQGVVVWRHQADETNMRLPCSRAYCIQSTLSWKKQAHRSRLSNFVEVPESILRVALEFERWYSIFWKTPRYSVDFPILPILGLSVACRLVATCDQRGFCLQRGEPRTPTMGGRIENPLVIRHLFGPFTYHKKVICSPFQKNLMPLLLLLLRP